MSKEYKYSRGGTKRITTTHGASTVLGKEWKLISNSSVAEAAGNTPGVDIRDPGAEKSSKPAARQGRPRKPATAEDIT